MREREMQRDFFNINSSLLIPCSFESLDIKLFCIFVATYLLNLSLSLFFICFYIVTSPFFSCCNNKQHREFGWSVDPKGQHSLLLHFYNHLRTIQINNLHKTSTTSLMNTMVVVVVLVTLETLAVVWSLLLTVLDWKGFECCLLLEHLQPKQEHSPCKLQGKHISIL
jgi:hypothetical protein